MLHEFVTENREEIISRCMAKTAKRSAPFTKVVSIHGVPMFLDELVDELRVGLSPNQEMSKTAAKHGHDLLRQGLSASQVVHGYGPRSLCYSRRHSLEDLESRIALARLHVATVTALGIHC